MNLLESRLGKTVVGVVAAGVLGAYSLTGAAYADEAFMTQVRQKAQTEAKALSGDVKAAQEAFTKKREELLPQIRPFEERMRQAEAEYAKKQAELSTQLQPLYKTAAEANDKQITKLLAYGVLLVADKDDNRTLNDAEKQALATALGLEGPFTEAAVTHKLFSLTLAEMENIFLQLERLGYEPSQKDKEDFGNFRNSTLSGK